MTVNGKAVTADVDARTLLVQYLRENLRLTGTHVGCDTSQCGACVVHVDGKAVKSCTMFAWQVEGANVTHHRGPGAERQAASDAGSLPRESRPAMRLLHARHDHDGGRYGAAARATSLDDKTIREELEGNHLPLHRLPQHREVDRRRREGDGVKLPEEADPQMHRNASRRRKRHERDRDRRGGPPQGRLQVHHRQGPVHRRHHAARARPTSISSARRTRTRRSRRSTAAAAKSMPGVVAVLTGADLADRQDRQSDLRLDDHLEGRLADEDGGASGDRRRARRTMSAMRSRW